MAHIKFEHVTLQYPIYNAKSMSLRNQFVHISTGGRLSHEARDIVTVTALNDASFELADGDMVGLVGHNGAGKTTLLRTMAGIYTPALGKVDITGSVSTIIELGAGMDSELSGYENIMRMGLLLGHSREQMSRATPDIEAFTELGDFLAMPVRTYSAGMTMRLMFAVTTSVKKDVLLVDEMFATGDKDFQKKAYDRMNNLINHASIFVLASHSEDLIKTFCNRIFLLQNGSVREIFQ